MWPFCKPKPTTGCWKHHILIFLAGAEAFHTLSHVIVAFSGRLPIYVWGYEWGQNANLLAIVVNALITLALLYFAKRQHDLT